MKTEWDYTHLAKAYQERAPYSEEALDKIFSIAGLAKGDEICDIGAGVGHLTIPLAERGYRVVAVEPNDAMRSLGRERTSVYPEVQWHEATGTNTGLSDSAFDFVSFGSSFNVMDRQEALRETARLLKSGKYFTCMWNHRDISDPIQAEIEKIIKSFIPDYDYGSRREDQASVISGSGLFVGIQEVTGQVAHTQSIAVVIEAWRSHGTVHRQAGDKFPDIIASIEKYLLSLGTESIVVPYTTRAWLAKKK